jgi:hypothetical protein
MPLTFDDIFSGEFRRVNFITPAMTPGRKTPRKALCRLVIDCAAKTV